MPMPALPDAALAGLDAPRLRQEKSHHGEAADADERNRPER